MRLRCDRGSWTRLRASAEYQQHRIHLRQIHQVSAASGCTSPSPRRSSLSIRSLNGSNTPHSGLALVAVMLTDSLPGTRAGAQGLLLS